MNDETQRLYGKFSLSGIPFFCVKSNFFDHFFFSEKSGRVKTFLKSSDKKKLGNDTY